ncbi:MAG: transposase [Candidatus Nitrosocosmicus sp.]|nr:transposase [Candidatus Nitrosocosmicus sp.]
MPAGRKWTAEEKANIVLEILTTRTSKAEVCRKYNFSRPTLVYAWRSNFVHAGSRGLYGTKVSNIEKQLKQENKRLKEMVAADLALANEF